MSERINYESNYFNQELSYYRDKSFNYMKREKSDMSNCPSDFLPIISLFEEDCKGKLTELRTDLNRLFIRGDDGQENCELMLRYGINNGLTIARVQFIHRHIGKMTELYRILESIQRHNKTGKIVIESVMTKEMENWCIKNGLIRKENSNSYIQP